MFVLVAGLVSAQPGRIQVSANQALTSCDIVDAPGLVSVFIYHINTSGATGSQFIVEKTGGAGITYLSETVTAPYLKIGTCAGPTATGCAIAYGQCLTGPFLILTLSYIGSGTSAPCGGFAILADPSADPPGLYVTDCQGIPNLLIGLGSTASIANDGSCPCPPIVPVEDTSWGQIKAIYQQ
jgi:hypothetical protein